VYLVHLSVLVILIGALIGSFSGFDAYVEIEESQQVDTVTLRKQNAPMKLGYEVRCDKFFVDFYENGSPKEFRSDLTFLHDGKEVEKKSLRVNHPVKFEGVTFYQSNYGKVPGKRVRVRIFRPESEQEITGLDIEVGKSFPLPGNEGQFRVAKTNIDFMQLGPAVLISARSTQGEETRFWVFQHSERIRKQFPGLLDQYPKLNPSAFTPYTFYLDAIESRYYTGLQVKKDPGVPVVWLGYLLMVAGLIVTFFTFHRRMWVRVSKGKQGVNVSVAGKAAKNPVGLERELKHLTTQLRNLFNEKR
jgi:cytochrome c biogenesis protein